MLDTLLRKPRSACRTTHVVPIPPLLVVFPSCFVILLVILLLLVVLLHLVTLLFYPSSVRPEGTVARVAPTRSTSLTAYVAILRALLLFGLSQRGGQQLGRG